MNESDLKLELSRMNAQQQQWHEDFMLKRDEYLLRERHWFWQKGFWIAVISIGMTTTAISVAALILKML